MTEEEWGDLTPWVSSLHIEAWKEKEKAKSLKLYEMAWYHAALPRQKRIPPLPSFMRNFMETTNKEMSEARAFHEEVLEMKRKQDGH